MRLTIVAAACTLVWTRLAIAAPARPDDAKLTSTVAELFTGAAGPSEGPPPVFAFGSTSAIDAPANVQDARGDLPDVASADTGRTKTTKRHDNARTIATAADGLSAWVAADLTEYSVCGMGDCDHQPPGGYFHALVLFDAATGWQPIVWHLTKTEPDKDYAASVKAKTAFDLDPLVRNVAGAEDAAKLFEASLGDPRLLAATIAERADVVLTGSEQPERAAGTAAVRGKLLAWNLAFKVRDGVRAGATASKTVAWVAANVDATSLKHPGATQGAYRVLAIYERTAGVWKLVALSFSHAAM